MYSTKLEVSKVIFIRLCLPDSVGKEAHQSAQHLKSMSNGDISGWSDISLLGDVLDGAKRSILYDICGQMRLQKSVNDHPDDRGWMRVNGGKLGISN